MASTTKIMTCILALEHLPEDAELSVSALAASQPEVRLECGRGDVCAEGSSAFSDAGIS